MFDTDANEIDKLSSEQRTRLAALVSNRWSTATNQIRDLVEESKEAWDYYLNNKPEDKNEGDRRGLRLGLIPRSVDSVNAILHNALFPADEQFFRATPKNPASIQHQELYERYKVVNHAESNLTEVMRLYLISLSLDPAAAMSVHWVKKTKRKVTYEPKRKVTLMGVEIPLPLFGLKEVVDDNFVYWEGSEARVLDFNDWRVDPNARSLEESWFTRRWYEPVWKIEEDFGIKDVKPYQQATDPNDADFQAKKREYGIQEPISCDEEMDGKSQALLMASYDDFVVDGRLYKNYVAVTLNGTELLWFGRNDYNHGRKPYIVHSLLKVPNQIYGLSLVKHAIPSAAVVDALVQLYLEVMKFSAKPIFEVDMTEPVFRKKRQVVPGMTFPVKRPNSIRQVPVSVANLAAVEVMMNKNLDNIREVTGASPMFTGEDFGNSPANITAFQVDQHMQGAHTRFKAMLTNFSNDVLEPFLVMDFENDRQFKETTEFIDIGSTFKELSPQLIKQLDFKWVVTSTQANLEKAKKIATLKELAFNILPNLVQAGVVSLSPQKITVNQYDLLSDLFVTGGLTNADKLLQVEAAPPPPVGPEANGEGLGGLQTLPGAEPGGPGPIPPGA